MACHFSSLLGRDRFSKISKKVSLSGGVSPKSSCVSCDPKYEEFLDNMWGLPGVEERYGVDGNKSSDAAVELPALCVSSPIVDSGFPIDSDCNSAIIR